MKDGTFCLGRYRPVRPIYFAPHQFKNLGVTKFHFEYDLENYSFDDDNDDNDDDDDDND